MSPEQAKGIKYSNKVDIYSLGIIYFELLTRFVTEMERICVLTALRQKRYPERFLETHSHEVRACTYHKIAKYFKTRLFFSISSLDVCFLKILSRGLLLQIF